MSSIINVSFHLFKTVLYDNFGGTTVVERVEGKSVLEILIFFSFYFLLKASFNNVKSEIHGPTCYQCL